jgi:predicted MFS family arabinose efflux permease
VTPLRRNREFVALWFGQAVSSLGISISSFAYPLVVLGATGSSLKAGLVGSVLTGTTFLLRLPAGSYVDRVDRKRLMILCDGGRALASASLATALALGHFYFAHVLIVAFVEGTLGTLFGPSESAAVRLVVAPEQRRDAVARNQSRTQIPGVLGPPLGGVLLSAGRALPFVADAISYLVSLTAILFLRTPLREPAGEHEETRSIFDGIRWLWARPFLRALLTWSAIGAVAFGGIGLVILVYARQQGASSSQLGVMFAITAAGGVAGALATPRLVRLASPRLIELAGLWTLAVSMLLMLTMGSPYLIGLLGAAAFFLGPAAGSLVFAAIAAEAPDHLQGRTTAGAIQIASLPAPLAPLLAGLSLSSLGVRHTVLVYAAFFLALAAGATASRGLRMSGEPGER